MSDPLREFNREDWADKPFLIRLIGGPEDGKEVRWAELPRIWQQAVRPTFTLPPPSEKELMNCLPAIAMYYETGFVADDGAHLYAFKGAS